MKRACLTAIVLIALAALLFGCIFKQQPYRGVMSYRHDKVYLHKNDYYTVGVLSAGWARMKTHARTISFYNGPYRSSITTDAICDRSEANRTLSSLAGGMAGALESRAVVEEREFMLDGRGALLRRLTGKIDGVATELDLVVTRKNECVFDFYLVAPKDADDAAHVDFETFYDGFRYDGRAVRGG